MPSLFIHHQRESLRYPGWDYSSAAGYFVTICVHEREHVFGKITGGKMILNELGRITTDWWQRIPQKHHLVQLDEMVIMPNHMHGIIWITPPACPVGTIHELSLPNRRRNELIPMILGYFKMQSAKHINKHRRSIGAKVWQRSYHDRIIRDKGELEAIRTYIKNNPINWGEDEYAHGNTRTGRDNS